MHIRSAEDYEAAWERIATLRDAEIIDGPQATELVALLAATEEWERKRETPPLDRGKPSRFAC